MLFPSASALLLKMIERGCAGTSETNGRAQARPYPPRPWPQFVSPKFPSCTCFFSHFIRALNLACVGAMRVDVAGFQFRTVDGHQTLLRRITSWGHPYPRDVISSILNHSFLTRINTGHNLTAGSKIDQNERPSNSVSEWVNDWISERLKKWMNETWIPKF